MLNGKRLCAWLMLALLLLSSLALPALAESAEVPMTWTEWKAARGAADEENYETVASAIEEVVNQAVALYEAGDKETAYKYAQAANSNFYKAAGFDSKVRTQMSGSDASHASSLFSALRKSIKNDLGAEAVKAAADELIAAIREQGTAMNLQLGIAVTGTIASYSELTYDNVADYADKAVPQTWEEWEAAQGMAGQPMNFETAAAAIDEVILKSVALYEAGSKDEAYEYAKATYWGYYETTGFERCVMTYISGGEVKKAEGNFTNFRTAVNQDKGSEAVRQAGNELSSILHKQGTGLNEKLGISGDAETSGSGAKIASFLGAFGIILREGLEAILIVGAIVAYLIKSGNKAAVKPVYIGAAFAVVCSFAMAAIIAALKRASAEFAMSQEIIEGIAALLAVCVLFYVSNWMVSKAESAAWNQYIESKVATGASRGSMFTLGFTAWLAVFREGAEVILFYQPLLQGNYAGMVWAGFGAGCLALVVVFAVIRFLSIKLPLKPFFLGTSILMAIMSVCFLGSGIMELMEGGVIDAVTHDWFPVTDVLDIFGIYPVFATLIPQMILLLIQVATFSYQIGKSKGMTMNGAKA